MKISSLFMPLSQLSAQPRHRSWLSTLAAGTFAASELMTGAIAIEPLSVVQNGSPLAGNWQLVRWGGSITQTTPIEGSQITATFEGDRLSGSSGCNAYNATFKASSTAVTIGPIAATRRLCQPALSAQEIEYFRALNTVNAYTITASGELQLTYPTKDGQGILRFAHQAVTQATE